MHEEALQSKYDVVILGAGLAGLSLARHLTRTCPEKSLLLLDNKTELPGSKQKVGESLVQVGGYYFSKVLDLEEHLFREHYLKYNLRFYWKNSATSGRDFEEYSQSYIRPFSNICSYQLNRNCLEEFLVGRLKRERRVDFVHPIAALEYDSQDEGHELTFRCGERRLRTRGEWLVDTTGRGQVLKRKLKLKKESPIDHGSSWCWVDGLVNVERLTRRGEEEIRKSFNRREQGWTPLWLATNHFMGEGFWFWVIPLQGLTSLGVVYDKKLFPAEEVDNPEKLIAWSCREFPLFRRDLPGREIVDGARLASYAYDCERTISPEKWALSGLSGRFTDPLYSPGSDLIAYYNTLIVDAIRTDDPELLAEKCELYEALMRILYEAYVPSYAGRYETLGDQETFHLKYAWELATYFFFFVYPFVNDLFTDRSFLAVYFRKFARLGPINRALQSRFTEFFRWKKGQGLNPAKCLADFMIHSPLREAEKSFYLVGVEGVEAGELLDRHLDSLREFALYIHAYCGARMENTPELITDRGFIRSIRLRQEGQELDASSRSGKPFRWNLDSSAMHAFWPAINDAGSRPGATGP